MVDKKRRIEKSDINFSGRDEKGFRRILNKKFLIIVLGVIIIGFIYFSLNTYDSCTDFECFFDRLETCEKAEFIGGDKMIFEYTILGSSEGKCEVNLKLIQGELDNQDSVLLEGKEMRCYIPLGVSTLPESDIRSCTGPLKEGLQDIVIQKLYSTIVQNIGRVNLEFAGIPGVNGTSILSN